jgi:Domain of unknown function (DUF4149)
MGSPDRWRALLAGLWAGWLLCVALLATPAPFALLPTAEAGRVVARMLAQEAYTSLALGIVLVIFERRAAKARVGDDLPSSSGSQFSIGLALALGALFCTVLGYFGTQPLMAGARAGQGAFSFGQLHAVSAVLYGAKLIMVLALAWINTTKPPEQPIRRPSS